jgi:hypothetical protein
MIFENYYVKFNLEFNINSISSYKIIMMKFINKFIKSKENSYKNKYDLYADAIIYSKYYLYYKTHNCIYTDKIMEILYDVDLIN